jgi:hypothetical protein
MQKDIANAALCTLFEAKLVEQALAAAVSILVGLAL